MHQKFNLNNNENLVEHTMIHTFTRKTIS